MDGSERRRRHTVLDVWHHCRAAQAFQETGYRAREGVCISSVCFWHGMIYGYGYGIADTGKEEGLVNSPLALDPEGREMEDGGVWVVKVRRKDGRKEIPSPLYLLLSLLKRLFGGGAAPGGGGAGGRPRGGPGGGGGAGRRAGGGSERAGDI